MQDKLKERLLHAVLVCLRPFAKIMLRCGVSYAEFSEVAKTAYVDVATNEYGLRGRPTNISRVAVMTGLTRKEIRRLRDVISKGSDALSLKTTPLSNVLHYWLSDDEFLDESGRPAELPFAGEIGSFSSLVRKYAGDVPPGAMRTELRRVGCIEENKTGYVKFIQRQVIPADQEERIVLALLHTAYPLLENVAFNMAKDNGKDSWPQLNVYTDALRKADLPRVRRIARDRFTEFAESFDDMFMAYETLREKDVNEEPAMVAICVSYVEDLDVEDGKWW
jgi:hypothetical protein